MGSCVSKSGHRNEEQRALGPNAPKSGMTQQTPKGNGDARAKRALNAAKVQSKASKPPEGNRLGGSSDGTRTGRDLAAQAAEKRFLEEKEMKKNSERKLKDMSRLSRSEKGL